VGTVHCPGTPGTGQRSGEQVVRIADIAPGGYLPADEGRRPGPALADAVRRAAPETRTDAPQAPDLVIVVGADPLGEIGPEELRADVRAAGVPHLAVRAGGDLAVVGPLVLPGSSSCLDCADLHRADRDPAWAALAVQLTVPRRGCPPADLGLSALTAAVAVLQVLGFLDGERTAAVEGTLELRLPDWRIRRRSWPAHPSCSCGAYRGPARADAARAVGPEPPDSAEWPA
jgi:bacteriocin biosynthesis cyclodehydratase domain-containing protein